MHNITYCSRIARLTNMHIMAVVCKNILVASLRMPSSCCSCNHNFYSLDTMFEHMLFAMNMAWLGVCVCVCVCEVEFTHHEHTCQGTPSQQSIAKAEIHDKLSATHCDMDRGLKAGSKVYDKCSGMVFTTPVAKKAYESLEASLMSADTATNEIGYILKFRKLQGVARSQWLQHSSCRPRQPRPSSSSSMPPRQ